jgi:hypothetical protein
MKQVFTFFLSILFVATAIAQETIDSTKNSPLEVSGSLDVYYQYNFNGIAPGLTSFTGDHNSFSLGMAKVALAKTVGKVGFGADVGFGPRANAANGGDFPNLQQLFVTYSPVDALTFTAGNFGTHVGYELIDPAANFHYSTSYMFSYGPFFHTGVKLDYAINDKLGVMVGVFDDTDSKFDVLDGKHIGAQVSYATDAGDIYLNYLTGTDGADTLTFNQVDLTAAFALGDKFTLGVNSTVKNIATESTEDIDDVSWYGGALYLGFAATDNFTIGLRGEYFNDGADAVFDKSVLTEAVDEVSVFATTLSANIKIGELTLIPEFRLDSASADVFEVATDDGAAAEFSASSPRFIFAAVYGF